MDSIDQEVDDSGWGNDEAEYPNVDPAQLYQLIEELENYATEDSTDTALPPPPPPLMLTPEQEDVQADASTTDQPLPPPPGQPIAAEYASIENAYIEEYTAPPQDAEEVDQSWEVPDLQAQLAGVDTSEYAPPPPPGPQWQAARPQQAGQQPGQPQQTWQRATPRGSRTGQ
jgi:hypothetical protein